MSKFKKPFVSRDNPHIPMKRAPMEDIENLFSVVSMGSLDKIREYVSMNNISLDVINKNNQSLLHIVIESEGGELTEKDKYRLCSYLIENGSPVDNFDNNNNTPLHLACKRQYEEIVKLLLIHGADPNVEDGKGMSPMHYVVQSVIKDCAPTKKVGALVEETKDDSGKDTAKVFDKKYRQIAATIVDVFFDPLFSKWIKHITATMLRADECYRKEFYELKVKLHDAISKVFTDVTDDEITKKRKINETLLQFREQAENIIRNNCRDGMKPEDIKIREDGIWGGLGRGNILTKMILEAPDFKSRTDMNVIRNNIVKKTKLDIDSSYTKLNNDCQNLLNMINRVEINYYNTLYLHVFFSVNNAAENTYKLLFGYYDMNQESGVDRGRYIAGPIMENTIKYEQQILTQEIDSRQELFFLGDGTNNNGQHSYDPDIYICNFMRSSSSFYHVPIKQALEWEQHPEKKPRNRRKVPLRDRAGGGGPLNYDSRPYIHSPDYPNTGANDYDLSIMAIGTCKEFPDMTNIKNYSSFRTSAAEITKWKRNDIQYMFYSRIKYSFARIIDHVKIIKHNLDYINTYLDKHGYQSIVQQIIPNIYVSIVNILQNLAYAEKDKDLILTRTSFIKNKFELFVKQYPRNRDNWAHEHAVHELETAEKMIHMIFNNVKSTYATCKTFIENVSKTVLDCINTISGANQMDKLFDQEFSDNGYEQVGDFFDNTIMYDVDSLPETFEKYYLLNKSMTHINFAKSIYEKYIPKITQDTFANYLWRKNPDGFGVDDDLPGNANTDTYVLYKINDNGGPITSFGYSLDVGHYGYNGGEEGENIKNKNGTKGFLAGIFNRRSKIPAGHGPDIYHTDSRIQELDIGVTYNIFDNVMTNANPPVPIPVGGGAMPATTHETVLPHIQDFNTGLFDNPGGNPGTYRVPANSIFDNGSHFGAVNDMANNLIAAGNIIDPAFNDYGWKNYIIGNYGSKDEIGRVINAGDALPGKNIVDGLYPSISALLPTQMKLIKLLLIMNVIQAFLTSLRSTSPVYGNDYQIGTMGVINTIEGTYLNSNQLRKTIELLRDNKIDAAGNIERKGFIHSIMETTNNYDPQNALSLFSVIVGKLADRMIVSFYNYLIQKSAIYFVSKASNQYSGEDLTNVISQALSAAGNKSSLFHTDSGFKVNFNELFTEMTKEFEFHTPPRNNVTVKSLRYGTLLMEDAKKPKKAQHKVYGIEYDDHEQLVVKCFIVDTDIITLLCKHRVNVNKQDTSGATPLHYAITLQHVGAVEKLLNCGASVSVSTVKNNHGKTPLDLAISLYKRHMSYIHDPTSSSTEMLSRIYEPFYKTIKKEIESDASNKNNILKYSKLLFPQIILMYSQMFYNKMRNYELDWNREDYVNLRNLVAPVVSADDQTGGNIPILNLSQSEQKEIVKYNSSVHVLVARKESLETKLKIAKDNQSILTKQNRDLASDLAAANPGPGATPQEIQRLRLERTRITKRRTDITGELAITDNNVRNLQQQIDRLINNMNRSVNTEVGNLNTRITDLFTSGNANELKSFDIDTLYKTIFEKVINDPTLAGDQLKAKERDYRGYTRLWRTFIKNNSKLTTLHSLPICMMQVQTKLLQDYKNGGDVSNILKGIKLSSKLFKNIIVNPIKIYQDNEQVWDSRENPILTKVLNAIEHVVSKGICSSLYIAILKVVTKHIMTLNPYDLGADKENVGRVKLGVIHSFQQVNQYNKIITKTMNNFVNGNGGKNRLETYILDDLPKQLIKFYLKIYEGDRDAARNTDDIDDLINPITSFVTTNSAVAIGKSSYVVKSLEDSVYPYFRKVFELFIPALKQIIDNFNNYLMNESRQLEIITLLLETAEKEKFLR